MAAPVAVTCPRCQVPYLRYGPRGFGWYRSEAEVDICIVCREGLDPRQWLPAVVVAVLLLVFSACASLPPSPTLVTIQQIQLLQQGGLYRPGDWILTGESHARYLTALERWAYQQGYTIAHVKLRRKDLLGHAGLNGEQLGWVLLVDADLPANAQLYILLHELTHAEQPWQTLRTPEAREVFAMLVAHQVCGRLGLDTSRETAAYLAALGTLMSLEQQRTVACVHADAIDRLVTRLEHAAKS